MFKDIKPLLIFFTLFGVVTVILSSFQLMGLTDFGYYFSFLYNFADSGSLKYILEGREINYLGSHFSPIWLIFSPLTFLDPISLSYTLFFIGYTAWFMAAHHVWFDEKKATAKESLLFFICAFASVTVLFNYNLTYNGIKEVLFAVPFLTIAYRELMIKERYDRAAIWYLPTLLIKEEFWLLYIFFWIAVFVRSGRKNHLLFALLAAIAFAILYFKVMRWLYGHGIGHLAGHYSHLFEAKSIGDLAHGILSLNQIPQRIALMVSFFVPFALLIRWRDVSLKDFVAAILIVGPTVGYCFLSQQAAMSNFLFDHYSLPIIPMLFALIVKYRALSKQRLFAYLLLNIVFIAGILCIKQPWQYRYYMDEKQLQKEVMPLVPKGAAVAVEDRTGIYFLGRNRVIYVNAVDMSVFEPQYIVVNTRYTYLANNVKFRPIVPQLSTNSYLNSFNKIQYFTPIYVKFPFLVYKKGVDGNLTISDRQLNEWDKKTVEASRWF